MSRPPGELSPPIHPPAPPTQGYEVHGIIRRSSSFNTGRIEHIYQDPHLPGTQLFLHHGDLTDGTNLFNIINKIRPDEVYNLGAQSHVMVSFELSEYTAEVDGVGTLRLLNAIRTAGLEKTCRFYQASTSELYGLVQEVPQSEKTPFYPRSPYAVAKQYAFWMVSCRRAHAPPGAGRASPRAAQRASAPLALPRRVLLRARDPRAASTPPDPPRARAQVVNYREAYGMHASNGILFNHESPRRGPTFVTRKVTRAVAAIIAGDQQCLYMGNIGACRSSRARARACDARTAAARGLSGHPHHSQRYRLTPAAARAPIADAKRDWGHARDYVEMMWMMLQADTPDDFVVATGEMHSVREFIEFAFKHAGIEIKWRGKGVDEEGYDAKDAKRVLVRIDPKYFRPTEVELLIGNPKKAKDKLKWTPRTTFEQLVKEMVECDMTSHKSGGRGAADKAD